MRTLQGARLRSLEDEATSLRPQCSVPISFLVSARVASAQLQSSLYAFTQAVKVAMGSSVSQLEKSMVPIATGALAYIDNCSLERDQTVIYCSCRSDTPQRYGPIVLLVVLLRNLSVILKF